MFRLLKIRGQSLFPDYQNGDFVLVSKIPIFFNRLHPGDVIAVLEARQEMERDEAHDLAVDVGDDHGRLLADEALQPLHDVARSRRIALLGEHGRDALGIADGGGTEDDGRLVDHRSMVPAAAPPRRSVPVAASASTIANGPQAGAPVTSEPAPSGPGRTVPDAGPGRPR